MHTHTYSHRLAVTYIHTQTDRHPYIIGQYAERGHYINTVPEEAVYIRWTLIIFLNISNLTGLLTLVIQKQCCNWAPLSLAVMTVMHLWWAHLTSALTFRFLEH